MDGLDVINILNGLDGLLKNFSWMDGLDVINILDGLDGCLLDGMDWMLDGLLTTLISRTRQISSNDNLRQITGINAKTQGSRHSRHRKRMILNSKIYIRRNLAPKDLRY